MNKVNLIGRLTKDVELRKNSADIPYTRFTLAVNRNFLNSNNEREADFISCVAWRKTAEIICNQFKKGSEFGASGRIQTGSYYNDKGEKVYTTDVVIDEITFVGKKDNKSESEYTGQPVEEEQVLNNDPFADFQDVCVGLDDYLD